MVGFIRFLYNHYDGFTIYPIPKFWPPKGFFGELVAKKYQFSDFFLEGKGYIFEFCLYRKLGNANVFALIDGTQFSWAACCDSFCQKCFSGQFLSKKLTFLNFSETN